MTHSFTLATDLPLEQTVTLTGAFRRLPAGGRMTIGRGAVGRQRLSLARGQSRRSAQSDTATVATGRCPAPNAR